MNENITLKGKEKIFNYFQKQKCAFWKLLNYDNRRVIAANTSKKNLQESFEDFSELIESVDQNCAYILELYAFTNPQEKQTFTRPFTTVGFSIDEDYVPKQVVTGGEPLPAKPAASEFSGKMTLESHLHLIAENARLLSSNAFNEQRVKELQARVDELEEECDHLNGIIDDYEEEEEEEKEQEQTVKGQPETPISILAGFVKENGKQIVEAMTKGKKVDVNAYQPPPQPENTPPGEEENPGATMNGIPNIVLPDLNIIIKQLQGIDPNLHEHLFKLLLIGQQKPETFKLLISQLDNI